MASVQETTMTEERKKQLKLRQRETSRIAKMFRGDPNPPQRDAVMAEITKSLCKDWLQVQDVCKEIRRQKIDYLFRVNDDASATTPGTFTTSELPNAGDKRKASAAAVQDKEPMRPTQQNGGDFSTPAKKHKQEQNAALRQDMDHDTDPAPSGNPPLATTKATTTQSESVLISQDLRKTAFLANLKSYVIHVLALGDDCEHRKCVLGHFEPIYAELRLVVCCAAANSVLHERNEPLSKDFRVQDEDHLDLMASALDELVNDAANEIYNKRIFREFLQATANVGKQARRLRKVLRSNAYVMDLLDKIGIFDSVNEDFATVDGSENNPVILESEGEDDNVSELDGGDEDPEAMNLEDKGPQAACGPTLQNVPGDTLDSPLIRCCTDEGSASTKVDSETHVPESSCQLEEASIGVNADQLGRGDNKASGPLNIQHKDMHDDTKKCFAAEKEGESAAFAEESKGLLTEFIKQSVMEPTEQPSLAILQTPVTETPEPHDIVGKSPSGVAVANGFSGEDVSQNNDHRLDGIGPSEAVNHDVASSDARKLHNQQTRLLLLWHASQCKLGASCTTKFCGKMVTLWHHLKTCRDKDCKVPHCLSSRTVINHYRICRQKGQTMTCEVCGPARKKAALVKQDPRTADAPGPWSCEVAASSPSALDTTPFEPKADEGSVVGMSPPGITACAMGEGGEKLESNLVEAKTDLINTNQKLAISVETDEMELDLPDKVPASRRSRVSTADSGLAPLGSGIATDEDVIEPDSDFRRSPMMQTATPSGESMEKDVFKRQIHPTAHDTETDECYEEAVVNTRNIRNESEAAFEIQPATKDKQEQLLETEAPPPSRRSKLAKEEDLIASDVPISNERIAKAVFAVLVGIGAAACSNMKQS